MGLSGKAHASILNVPTMRSPGWIDRDMPIFLETGTQSRGIDVFLE